MTMSAHDMMNKIFALAQELASVQTDRGGVNAYRTQYVRYIGELEAILGGVVAIHCNSDNPDLAKYVEFKLHNTLERFQRDLG